MRTSANTRSRSIAPSCQASHRSSLTAIIFNHMKSCWRMITSWGGWHIFLMDDALSRSCQNCGGMEFGDLEARVDVDGAREGVFGLAVTRDGTKIIISDDNGNITVWSVETTKLSKNGLTQRAGQRLSSHGWSTHCGWCLGGVHLHHGRATGQPFPRGPIRPQSGVLTERNSHAALMTASTCMTSALAHSDLQNVTCCATAANPSLARDLLLELRYRRTNRTWSHQLYSRWIDP